MKRIIIICLFIMSILLVSCAADITKQSLEGRTILLSTPKIDLDPLQSQDVYLGVNNLYETDEQFEIVIECTVIDCSNYILAQTFPSIGIAGKKMGAFPIRIMALEDAIPGLYPFQLTVKHKNEVHGTAKLTVQITQELQQKKQELEEKFK